MHIDLYLLKVSKTQGMFLFILLLFIFKYLNNNINLSVFLIIINCHIYIYMHIYLCVCWIYYKHTHLYVCTIFKGKLMIKLSFALLLNSYFWSVLCTECLSLYNIWRTLWAKNSNFWKRTQSQNSAILFILYSWCIYNAVIQIHVAF